MSINRQPLLLGMNNAGELCKLNDVSGPLELPDEKLVARAILMESTALSQSGVDFTGFNGPGLYLEEKGLTMLPVAVQSLSEQVKVAFLARNKFRQLPPEILRLVDLVAIDISHNPFFRGFDLSALKKLQILWADNTGLTSVPEWIKDSSVTSLSLKGNRISRLPPWFHTWRQGKTVYLDENAIRTSLGQVGCPNAVFYED